MLLESSLSLRLPSLRHPHGSQHLPCSYTTVHSDFNTSIIFPKATWSGLSHQYSPCWHPLASTPGEGHFFQSQLDSAHLWAVMLVRLSGWSFWGYWETQSHSKVLDPLALNLFPSPLLQCLLSMWVFCDVSTRTRFHKSECWLVVVFYSGLCCKEMFFW